MAFDLSQAVTDARVEIEGVEFFQVANTPERWGAERNFAIEGVEHDAFEQVSQGYIVIFGQGLQDFEEAFLHADPGLDALNENFWLSYHGTNVPWYIGLKPISTRLGRL